MMREVAVGAATDRHECRSCVHFRNDPAYLESVFEGLAALSSAHGSARAEDGICLRHDRYLAASASCADWTPRQG